MLIENTRLDTSMFFPEVYQVYDAGDYVVHAYFNDGSIHAYDVKPLLEKGGIFEKLRDPDTFHSLLTVMNGTVAWDTSGTRDPYHCIDLDPFDIFNSTAVSGDL